MENMFLTTCNNNFSTSFKCDQVHVPNHEHVQWELWPVLGDYTSSGRFSVGKKRRDVHRRQAQRLATIESDIALEIYAELFTLCFPLTLPLQRGTEGAGCFKSLAQRASEKSHAQLRSVSGSLSFKLLRSPPGYASCHTNSGWWFQPL